MPNVLVYLDDILITGKTDADHVHTLEQVWMKLNIYGFHMEKEKCYFLKPEVVFWGHNTDHHGIH